MRSMRTTDLELVPLFGRPLFAASGGNAGVVPQIQAANLVDIGNHVSGEGFVRNGGRPAPHNLFTSTPALYGKSPESRTPAPLFSYLARRALPGPHPGRGSPCLRGPSVAVHVGPRQRTCRAAARVTAVVTTGGSSPRERPCWRSPTTFDQQDVGAPGVSRARVGHPFNPGQP